MKIDLKNLTIQKAHEALKKGDFTSVELTQAYLDEIKKNNGDVNAYLEVFADALEQAKKADEKIHEARNKKQDFSLLLGIPCGIKDNILIQGRIASAASKILENYQATYDATVISKLKEAGVVFVGRTKENLIEAMRKDITTVIFSRKKHNVLQNLLESPEKFYEFYYANREQILTLRGKI